MQAVAKHRVNYQTTIDDHIYTHYSEHNNVQPVGIPK